MGDVSGVKGCDEEAGAKMARRKRRTETSAVGEEERGSCRPGRVRA